MANQKVKKKVTVSKSKKPEAEAKSVVEAAIVSGAVVEPEPKPEVQPEVKIDQPQTPPETEKSTGVRLEAVEVVQPEAALAKAQPEDLKTSIDNLAKIVDQGEVKDQPKAAEPEKTEKKTGYLWMILAFLVGLLLGVAVGWFIWGKGEKKTDKIQPAVKPTISQPSPTKAATSPVPTTALDRSLLKIQVLNGTEAKGVAAKARDTLKALGYSDVTIGNAEKSDYQLTEISLKTTKAAYLETLKKDLTDSKYILADTIKDMDTGSEYDAVVIIGLK